MANSPINNPDVTDQFVEKLEASHCKVKNEIRDMEAKLNIKRGELMGITFALEKATGVIYG